MSMLAVATLAAAALATGCGSAAAGRATSNATLVLDFTPNAIHAGIYSAIARGYDRTAGVRLHVVAPTASTDSIKLLETGRANFAILDIHDLAIAREQDQDIVGIMAIVERPLAAVISAPAVRSPRELQGKTVGITGDPSDTAVLRSIVVGAGGNPRQLKTVTVGFNAVPDLLAGRVAAATAFWNDEGVALARSRPGFHIFLVDDYGAPSYPELVLCATGQELRRDPGLAQAVVRSLVRGYEFTVSHPTASADELEARVPGLNPNLVSAELAGELPAFKGPDGVVGELDPTVLRAWASWETRFGIVRRVPNVAETFDFSFVEASPRSQR